MQRSQGSTNDTVVDAGQPAGAAHSLLVTLRLSSLPLLDGALQCVEAGILSSLQPANLRLRQAIRNPEAFVKDPRYALLFDPQTAGALLASVPAAAAPHCIAALQAAGYRHGAVIGRVTAQGDRVEPIVLEE